MTESEQQEMPLGKIQTLINATIASIATQLTMSICSQSLALEVRGTSDLYQLIDLNKRLTYQSKFPTEKIPSQSSLWDWPTMLIQWHITIKFIFPCHHISQISVDSANGISFTLSYVDHSAVHFCRGATAVFKIAQDVVCICELSIPCGQLRGSCRLYHYLWQPG